MAVPQYKLLLLLYRSSVSADPKRGGHSQLLCAAHRFTGVLYIRQNAQVALLLHLRRSMACVLSHACSCAMGPGHHRTVLISISYISVLTWSTLHCNLDG